MNTLDSILEEFDEKFTPKTFDSYQGWDFEDIKEVKQFLEYACKKYAKEVLESLDVEDETPPYYANVLIDRQIGYNQANQEWRDEIKKTIKELN